MAKRPVRKEMRSAASSGETCSEELRKGLLSREGWAGEIRRSRGAHRRKSVVGKGRRVRREGELVAWRCANRPAGEGGWVWCVPREAESLVPCGGTCLFMWGVLLP